MDVPKPSIITRLPEELRASILSFCDSSAVLNLCLASKATHSTCLPSLFHTVDLSTHHEDSWRQHGDYINVVVPADHPRRILTNRDCAILQRQRRFIDLLRTRPDVGSQVRVLRYTIMDVPHRVDAGLAPLRTSDMLPERPVDIHTKLWQIFTLLTRVVEVDIAFLIGLHDQNPPCSLFSTATSISLTGVAGHTMLAPIFDSLDPSKLRHLRLNNVQAFADPRDIRIKNGNTVQTYKRDRPGAIQGYLTPLIGRCPSLRSLHILTTSAFVDLSTTLRGLPSLDWGTENEDDHYRYAEMGDFLSSVKSTLREFLFEHGPDIDYYGNSPGRHTNRAFAGPSHNDSLPMDIYFDTHILPVIASGPWPKLEKIVVRGIGHWKPLDPWREESTADEISYLHRKAREFRDRAEMIWDAVGGKSVDIVVEDEASQPFYRLQADKRQSITGEVA